MNLDPVTVAVGMLARPATLIRAGGAWAPNGTWQESAPTETSIAAVIQAPSPEDMESLPAGEQVGGLVAIWTTAALHTSSEDDEAPADVVRAPDGTEYRIVSVKRREEAGFTRALGRRTSDRGRDL